MTAHATLGASSSKRWMNCPGSVRLSAGIPDKTSVFAAEGTIAHEVVETVLGRRIRLEGGHASDLIGVHLETDGELIAVTEEMATAAQVMIDHVCKRYFENDDNEDSFDADVDIWLERRFDLSVINAPEPMFGTADVTLWIEDTRHLEVIDYKHGQGVVVEAEENSQLMYYALGATISIGKIPDTIRVTIVQPRAAHPDGPIRSYDFDRERLIQFKHELFEAAKATQVEDAPLAVGDWCKFCRARATCPAQFEHAQSVAMVEFEAEPQDLPVPVDLELERLAFVVEKAPLVMDWLRSVESHALDLMQQGIEIPGLKLVEGRSNRRWRDAEAAEKYLARKGLKKEERNTFKVISPAQAEKKLKAQGVKLDHLERLWEKPEGQPKLALAADSRPALPSSVEADFGTGELPPATETD